MIADDVFYAELTLYELYCELGSK